MLEYARCWRAAYSADTTQPAPQRRSLNTRTTRGFLVPGSLLLAFCTLTSCESTKIVKPDYSAREVVALERWAVEVEGKVLGAVTKYEIRDPKSPVQFFRVTDASGRWLGHATKNGRFSRRVPFEKEEQDLGVLAMQRGVAELFEASQPVRLKPVPVEAVWQSQPKLQQDKN